MLDKLRTASNIEEIGKIFLEFWEQGTELDSFSAVEINEFRKILINRNLISLAKKLTPPESYEFNRFNLTRAVLSELNPKSGTHQKLKFGLWQRLITNKTINFMSKTTNPETLEKLKLLLISIKSLSGINKPLTQNDQAKRFVILSDLASQLGYEMFALMAAKKSLSTDPDCIDAAIFVGRAYLELGTLYAKKVGKNADLGSGTYQYNLQKSNEIFINALNKLTGSQKQQVSSLISSISGVLSEIDRQKQQGKNTIVHVVVADYIKDRMEKVESAITAAYENSEIKFAANIHPELQIETLLTSAADQVTRDTGSTLEDTLTVIPRDQRKFQQNEPAAPKTGKLFNIYNQQAGYKAGTTEVNKEMPQTTKSGSVTSDEIGYKLKLEDILKERIKEKNEEFFNKKS